MNQFARVIANETENIPRTMASPMCTDLGILGQMKGPNTREGIKVTRSNPCCSANSRAALSVHVLAIKEGLPITFRLLK
jgi:hypothetical protein